MGNTIQQEPLADGFSKQEITRFEQLGEAGLGEGRSASFRARARNTLKFFDTLPDAREWAEHLLCREFPEIFVEEDVRGLWELRELHTASRS
ncbi:MAG TPA: hypothetical protein VJM81_07885 [Rhizorhapis sp.]|nr:hypothetical protein [Rhizomicrobium sp.]HKX23178.1 hypothetical protein [Rhizorhapis sp.]